MHTVSLAVFKMPTVANTDTEHAQGARVTQYRAGSVLNIEGKILVKSRKI